VLRSLLEGTTATWVSTPGSPDERARGQQQKPTACVERARCTAKTEAAQQGEPKPGLVCLEQNWSACSTLRACCHCTGRPLAPAYVRGQALIMPVILSQPSQNRSAGHTHTADTDVGTDDAPPLLLGNQVTCCVLKHCNATHGGMLTCCGGEGGKLCCSGLNSCPSLAPWLLQHNC